MGPHLNFNARRVVGFRGLGFRVLSISDKRSAALLQGKSREQINVNFGNTDRNDTRYVVDVW